MYNNIISTVRPSSVQSVLSRDRRRRVPTNVDDLPTRRQSFGRKQKHRGGQRSPIAVT